MAGTLYYLLPPRMQTAESEIWPTRPFALTNPDGGLMQQGESAPDEMADLIRQARQVVLLLAASDVTMLAVKVPPLSPAKLKQALPNLIEEYVLGDPGECVLLAHAETDETARVAIADKSWISRAFHRFHALGAKKVSAYPLQECLAAEPDRAVAVLHIQGDTGELAVRTGAHAGSGMTLYFPDATAAARQTLAALQCMHSTTDLDFYVPSTQLQIYCDAAHECAPGVTVKALNWESRIGGISPLPFDMMNGVRGENTGTVNWKAWRWPLTMLAATILVNAIALNVEWFGLRRDAKRLHDAMQQTFKATFPKQPLVAEPLLQMRQKIKESERLAGQPGTDDFVALASGFAQVWDRLNAGSPEKITSLEYRERSLFVTVQTPPSMPAERIRTALSEQGLMLASTTNGVLRIQAQSKDKK